MNKKLIFGIIALTIGVILHLFFKTIVSNYLIGGTLGLGIAIVITSLINPKKIGIRITEVKF